METIFNKNGSTTIKHHYRDAKGLPTHSRVTIASQKVADVVKAKAALLEKCEKRSLTNESILFEELIDYTVGKNQGAGQIWVYNAVRDAVGKCKVDKKFISAYDDYIESLKESGKSQNTINHHKSVVRRCLNLGYQKGLIDSIPVRSYDISLKFRDRIWAKDEKQRIYEAMQQIESHLYWSVWFAERRPIRGNSDLWQLTNDNLVLFGENAPYIRFRAKKTAKRKPRDTYLPLGDLPEIVDYFKHGRPNGCAFLFPNDDGNQMGNPKRHWNTICRKAKVDDLHFHDLKHVAITHMLDNGYSVRDLQNLRIQFSEEMINRVYYNYGADKVLKRVNSVENHVEHFLGGSPERCVNIG